MKLGKSSIRRLAPWRWLLAVTLAALLGYQSPPAGCSGWRVSLGSVAWAQTGREDEGTGEVKVEVDQFGLGNAARAGSWVGVRVKLTDQNPKQRAVVVSLTSTDYDGDFPEAVRVVTLNPGATQPVWLYARLKYAAEGADRTFTLSVNEEPDEAIKAGDELAARARAGRLLAVRRLSSQGVAPKFETQFAVVGRGLGLGQYVDKTTGEQPALGHDRIRVIEGLTPDAMPDRWMGLQQCELIAWGAGEPGRLRGDSARAVRQWVQMGGHLVIVLPPAGQTWTAPDSNELYDIMPLVNIRRNEGVDLGAFAPMLSKTRDAALPTRAVVHQFAPRDDAKPDEAEPILTGPDGGCVVVRRLVGSGAVTLVGIDLNQASLTAGAFDADVFWHRVLGRRGELLSAKEISAMQGTGSMWRRSPYDLDARWLFEEINTKSSAAQGVLLGFLVFVLYWVVAGPGAFSVLKRYGLSHWAWPAYVASAAAFTVLAWTGATAVRPGKLQAAHFTVLDHVHGQDFERTRGWISLMVPWYGTARLQVGDEDGKIDAPGGTRGVGGGIVAPWDPPEAQTDSGSAGFPDTRPYAFDTRSADVLDFPARSTVKQFQVDWGGKPRWKLPLPERSGGEPDKPGRLWLEGAKVRGAIKHEMPTELRNVTIVVVSRQLPMTQGNAAGRDRLRANADAFTLTDPWPPGRVLDLGEVLNVKDKAGDAKAAESRQLMLLLDSCVTKSTSATLGGEEQLSPIKRLLALSFYGVLPNQLAADLKSSTNDGLKAAMRRSAFQGLDLSRWLTQPCVIVIGELGDARASEMPTPLFVDGKPLASAGKTFVRWVYPLEANPPEWPEASQDSKDEGKSRGTSGT